MTCCRLLYPLSYMRLLDWNWIENSKNGIVVVKYVPSENNPLRWSSFGWLFIIYPVSIDSSSVSIDSSSVSIDFGVFFIELGFIELGWFIAIFTFVLGELICFTNATLKRLLDGE